jgi:hypothetical protein
MSINKTLLCSSILALITQTIYATETLRSHTLEVCEWTNPGEPPKPPRLNLLK